MIELPTFPATFYHPVHGAVTVDTPEKASALQPATDWFHTAAEADAHRTENEAQVVIHYARRGQVMKHEQSPTPGIVHHSVTHQATVDRQLEAATAAAKANDLPEPKQDDSTRGAELLT